MKKLTILMVFALTFLFSCSKKDVNPVNQTGLHNAVQGSTTSLVQLKNENGKLTAVKINVNMGQHQLTGSNDLEKAGVTPHYAICHFNGVGLEDTSNVITNNGGIHGHISLNGFIACELTPSCLEVEGNEGVYSGVITSVSNDGGYPQYIAVGNSLSIRVQDNGEGKNASADQVANTIYVTFGVVDCTYDWFSIDWTGYSPITSGFIHVK